MITVGELIIELQKLDPNKVVILQKDSEGNGYSPMAEVDDNALYAPDTTYSGEVSIEKLDEKAIRQGFTEEEIFCGDDVLSCVVLCPAN
jgi:hypothetical protein